MEAGARGENRRLEALETYTCRDNLIITGLPVTSYSEIAASSRPENRDDQNSEALETAVIELFNDRLGLLIRKDHISIAHRLSRKRGSHLTSDTHQTADTSLLTIVKFANRKAREAVYAARRKLRSVSGPRIFINEDLCKPTADLYRRARQLVRERSLHSAWTSSCTVFVKESAEARPRKVLTVTELP